MALSSFLLLLLSFLFFSSAFAASSTFNVVDFGAKPDAKTDSSKAFQAAWANACGFSTAASIYVPKGIFYLSSASFVGPCNNGITLRIDGTLVAPSDFRLIGNSENWIIFRRVDGVTILGGILDGQGTNLWACKRSRNSCPPGATSLEFSNSKNIIINALTSINSQKFHIVVNQCQNVIMQGMKISASGNSPNTDGIHVEKSSTVTILKSNIATGDDCISIGPGTTNLWIENVTCGPGHGISIGSLGNEGEEEAGVQNVTVKSASFINTENGVRIKTWGKPNNGFVRNILFQDILMANAQNPIIIDQNYCPNNEGCSGQASGVKIDDVTYRNIHGASATQVAMKFDCSPKFPCSRIRLEDVNLSYNGEEAEASCSHAGGIAVGLVQPSSCLQANS